ncbi:hypothetical protein [Nocardioides coralli]|nr:hypothetical protein [Nocardioides coralli]
MKIAKKLAIVLTTAVLGVGLLGGPATARDSSWGCGGCAIAID